MGTGSGICEVRYAGTRGRPLARYNDSPLTVESVLNRALRHRENDLDRGGRVIVKVGNRVIYSGTPFGLRPWQMGVTVDQLRKRRQSEEAEAYWLDALITAERKMRGAS